MSGILWVEELSVRGNYRITVSTEGGWWGENDIIHWLWKDDDEPAGTQLEQESVYLGYVNWMLTGVETGSALDRLTPEALQWFVPGQAHSYRDKLDEATQRPELERQLQERWNTVHPITGLTFRQLYDTRAWWGIHEVNGHFVEVGTDDDGRFVVSTLPYWQIEKLNNDLRWFVAHGSGLREAIRQVDEHALWVLKTMVMRLAAGAF